MPVDVGHVGEALSRAEDVAVEMVRQGRLDYAMKTVLGAIREALLPLVESVNELTADVGELKGRVVELTNNLDILRCEVSKLTINVDKLSADVRDLREGTADLERSVEGLKDSVSELREHTADLERSIRELGEHTAELERGARELRWSLEKEVELRRKMEGEIGRLRGYVLEALLGERLADWCARHGLALVYLPREYRADAAVLGERLVALVQIAEVGDEGDVEQLLEGAKIYEREEGVRPHALVLYVRTKRPPEGVVRLCEEHGIILETSPRRIALRLAELDEELGSGGGE